MENGIQKSYVLEADDALVLSAIDQFEDDTEASKYKFMIKLSS